MIANVENLNKNKINKELSESKEDFLNNFSIDSFCYCHLGNTFCVFKSSNNGLYLIYSGENKAIISFDLNDNKKINEIKNAHNEYITDFKHYLDQNKKIDLIMTTSTEDNNIKIWNFKNFECLLNLEKIYNDGFIYSSSFLLDNNQIYIITSNCNWYSNSENMKVFDLNGKQIKVIKNSNEQILFLDAYYDNILSKYYIIIGTIHYVKSYDYENNEVYHEYYEVYNSFHLNIIIYKKDNIIQLIDSSTDGYIRIWNFHTNALITKIYVAKGWLYGICLWKEDYLLVGYFKNIKIIDLKKRESIKTLESHKNKVITITKFVHPKYGYCFLSQGYKKDKIKLWLIKNNL